MSVPPNIDLFNRFSLAVFKNLYVSFPISIELDVNDLMMSVTPTGSSFDETFDALKMGARLLASFGLRVSSPTRVHFVAARSIFKSASR